MQCSNCQFENMPGIATCGRCGAGLQLASLQINVNPPRAGHVKRTLRRWFPTIYYWNRFRAFAASVAGRLRTSGWPVDIPSPTILLRAVVPGWPQRCLGRNSRALWMFFGYLGSLLTGLLFMGSVPGWILLGLAIAVQAASIMDIAAEAVYSFQRRLVYYCTVMILLVSVLYYPIGRTVGLVAQPQQFNQHVAPFEAGDVVLMNPSAYLQSDPRPGDVVCFNLPDLRIPSRRADGYAMMYHLRGTRVDRILARSGQKVVSDKGQLLVDGQPAVWSPLTPRQLPDSLDITVPENSFLIFPSGENLPIDVLLPIVVVQRERILGRVYWQNYPPWRFGPIN